MNSCIFEKYLAKKKKDVLTYAQELEKIIEVENNLLWQNSKAFTVFVKDIIDYFVDNYYFNVKYNSKPIEYLKNTNKTLLYCIQLDCENKKRINILQENQREIFLTIIIISMASYIDKSSNSITGDYKITKTKFKTMLNDIKNIKKITIKTYNQKNIQDLFNAVKKNINVETKFFDMFMSTTSYNQYIEFTKSPQHYLVKYHYSIPSLYEYNSKLVKNINKKHELEYSSIMLDLLNVQLLKEMTANNKVYNYLIPIEKINKPMLLKKIDNTILKQHVKILIDYKAISNYETIIKEIENKGINIVYDYSSADEVNVDTFKENTEIIINKVFKENNLKQFKDWEQKGIKFILKSNKEEVR